MRRIAGFVSLAAAILLALAAGGAISGAGAQQGPPPGGFEVAPGVTAEALAFEAGREDPSVYRLTFAPGTTYAFEESPALELAYIESGALAMTFSVPVTVADVDAPDTAGVVVEAQTETMLEAGNYVALPPLTAGEVRNDGDEPAVVTISNIIPGGNVATPQATPAA